MSTPAPTSDPMSEPSPEPSGPSERSSASASPSASSTAYSAFATAPTPGLAAVGPRVGGDRCPGALRMHEAADGRLARIRVPGGLLTADQVRALVNVAVVLGDGRLHVTARGNVEVRAVSDRDLFTSQLDNAGLLPAASHERVRNIVASPMAGLDEFGSPVVLGAGFVPAVRALDAALLAEPALADLSGRFLFGLDDGRGDVLSLEPDLAVVLLDPASGEHATPGPLVRLVVGTEAQAPLAHGPVLALADAPRALITAALAFLAHVREVAPDSVWRFEDLADPAAAVRAVRAAVEADVPTHPTTGPTRLPLPGRRPANAPAAQGGPTPGVHVANGSATLVAALPLGSAPASAWRLAAEVARAADGLVRTTPWRSLVIGGQPTQTADAAAGVLTEAGFVLDPLDPWTSLGACTGLPGCLKSRADVREAASRVRTDLLERSRDARGLDLPVYLSGCERRCGHPRTTHVDAVAIDATTYRVGRADHRDAPAAGRTVPRDELARAVTRTARTAEEADEAKEADESVTDRYDYITDGAEIYRRSFATIRAEADLSGYDPDEERVAVRMIHAAGEVDLTRDIAFSPGAVAAGMAALRAGAPILTDVQMVASGVTRRRLPADNEVICLLSDPRVAPLAAELGTTRTAAAVELWRDRLDGAVVAIGNAPTALFHLLQRLHEWDERPAVILGIPVGFIGAAESKAALTENDLGLASIVVHGRRGGSAITCGALNALSSTDE